MKISENKIFSVRLSAVKGFETGLNEEIVDFSKLHQKNNVNYIDGVYDYI